MLAGHAVAFLMPGSILAWNSRPLRLYVLESAALIFGGAFHRAVELAYQARLAGRPMPSFQELLEEYRRSWQAEAALTPEVVHAKGDPASLGDLAERMLEAFVAHLDQEAASAPHRRILALEHADRFRLLPDAPPMEARLDVLELDGTDLLVSEVKTSRSRWNDQKVAESLPQLVVCNPAACSCSRTSASTQGRKRTTASLPGSLPGLVTCT